MKKIKIYKLKSFSKSTGKLVPITFNKKFPFKIKRIFYLYGKKNKIRGEHAHKKCSQFFVPIFGKINLNIKTPKNNRNIKLSHKSKIGVLVPPKYWCGVKFLTNNAILMVICDQYYYFNDYLETFKDYKRYCKKI
tara:strand:+ start:508 stop:912 length:405 start_codon:yes stop_codon:yes gene_type:complete